ncbi:RNA polymerase sigma factor/ type III [Synechococcus sp. A18-46.1]|nr:RNA polymerase sigma factor/ type III [Synechococcus sp. A18-46.1]
MTTSGWQRRELRRTLPPAVRQRNIKVLNHLGIAGMIASRETRRGPEERDDLEQEARVGLIRGWERFDPRRGLKPSTFLSTAANGQVLHFRCDRAGTIRVPWRLRDTYVKGQAMQQEQMQRGGPALSDAQLADALNITVQRWQEACSSQQAQRMVPISAIHEQATSPVNDDLEDRWLDRGLALLKPQQRQLLQRHFIEGDSVRRIASATGVPQHQLRKSIRNAIELLQHWAQQDGLLPLRSCRQATASP